MKLSKEKYDEIVRRYQEDPKFKRKLQGYFYRYRQVPSPNLKVDVENFGHVEMWDQDLKRKKRTFVFDLGDGKSGDVWFNAGVFKVRVNGSLKVEKDDFVKVKELVYFGFFGLQVVMHENNVIGRK